MRKKGQALAELVICLPFFVLFMIIFIEMAQLFIIKLELNSLCREAALLQSRVYKSNHSRPDNIITSAVKHIAAQGGLLDPQRIDVKTKPLAMPSIQLGAALGTSSEIDQVLGKFSGAMLGQEITISYRVPLKGLASIIFRSEFILKEKLAYKADFWKHPVENTFKSLLE